MCFYTNINDKIKNYLDVRLFVSNRYFATLHVNVV